MAARPVLAGAEVRIDARGGPDARTAVRCCRMRRMIEEFFRVLKTGLRAEDRRFDHVDDLRKWGC